MEQAVVPEIQVSEPSANPDAQAMALTGDNAQDLQNIAKEMGVTVDINGNVVDSIQAQPAPVAPQPEQARVTPTQAADTKPQAKEEKKATAPQKFLNPDGSVNEEKLSKSSASLDDAITKYRAKEREFHQIQNRVNNPMAPAQPAPPAQVPLSPLEIQVARDLIAEHAAVGFPITEAQAIATARVQVRLIEAKHNVELNATEDLRNRVEDNERRRELQGLFDEDQALASPEMAESLWKIRQENPWLNKSPEPWRAAYYHFRGSQGRAQQVKTPTPTGLTAKAPPTPVGPVTRVQPTVNVNDPKSLTNEQLESEIRKIFPNFRGQ